MNPLNPLSSSIEIEFDLDKPEPVTTGRISNPLAVQTIY